MKELIEAFRRRLAGDPDSRPGSRQVVSKRDVEEQVDVLSELTKLGRECAIIIGGDPKDVMFVRNPADALNAVRGVMVLARAFKDRDKPLEEQFRNTFGDVPHIRG